MFDRIDTLISEEKRKLIEEKTVLIIGLGGVGGYSVEALVRSGIGNIIIVDYDIIDISNINRQIIATSNSIGKIKTDLFYNRIKEINKNCNVIKIDKLINKENYLCLFEHKFDYLIDACDTIETKKILIKECLNRNIKFISCMGTAKKKDPLKLNITDLRKTSYDKIAKILRKWIQEEKLNGKVPVVSSDEEIINCEDNSLGSMIFVPSVAGILCAKYIIDEIIKENVI